MFCIKKKWIVIQTLMKSNAQLRHEGQDKAPQPPPVQFEIPIGASSS
jgi:hypothetical protein